MAKFNCVDCGIEIESKLKKPYNRRCPACTEASGPMVPSNSGYKVIREEVGVRELKANPTELIHMLEETPGLEIIITRYGKPAAKLVSLKETSEDIAWEDRISLRGTWAHMRELTDEDFAEAKKIWEPRIDV
jgi:prevent-host-death family protein